MSHIQNVFTKMLLFVYFLLKKHLVYLAFVFIKSILANKRTDHEI